MRVVIQKVSKAQVDIKGQRCAAIEKGLLILLGIENNDDEKDIEWLSGKIVNLRIFDDENGLINLGLKDVDGNILLVSQFTLFASTKKGNRPSFLFASTPLGILVGLRILFFCRD